MIDTSDASTIWLLRVPAVVARRGDSRSRMYRDIDAGTWTPPVATGPRLACWPSNEVDVLIRARIAGATQDELRSLVRELLAERAQMWQRPSIRSHETRTAAP